MKRTIIFLWVFFFISEISLAQAVENSDFKNSVEAKMLELRVKYAEAETQEKQSFSEMKKARTFSNIAVAVVAGSAILIRYGMKLNVIPLSSTKSLVPNLIKASAIYGMTVNSHTALAVGELYASNKFINHFVTEWSNKLQSKAPKATETGKRIIEIPLFLLNIVATIESPIVLFSAGGNTLIEESLALHSANGLLEDVTKSKTDFDRAHEIIQEKRKATATSVSGFQNVISLGYQKRFATQSKWEADLMELMLTRYEYHYYADLLKRISAQNRSFNNVSNWSASLAL